ncbi:MAG: DNA-directed RNA polymerase subunit alpha [Candidatus Marinimicrobia bacterium]|nr:DNA-directed RNA polymerase subunit alpha [Candidatus Neomarinimicrobiota bacterium]
MSTDSKIKISVVEVEQTDKYGKFVIQPLERGYGVTLGSALRRVLLTSVPGAAITSIKIEDVLHEFSTIKGIKEDIADLILNLKGVRFKLTDQVPDKVELVLEGEGVFTAADIQEISDEFEILNPDHYITEYSLDQKLNIEFKMGIGKGYIPAEENVIPNAPIGTIAIDSIFNPVTKVTFDVQPVPGAKDPIEILTIDINTDGSILPGDVLSYSSKVLIDHFKIIEMISKPKVLEVTEGVSEEVLKIRGLLNSTIDEMELSVRSHNCLQAAGIKYIYELVNKEENAMLKYKNFGRKSLTELVEKLDEMGLHFGMDVDKYLIDESV